MKFAVYFVSIAIGAVAMKSAGISISEAEYWIAYASLQLGGFCLGQASK